MALISGPPFGLGGRCRPATWLTRGAGLGVSTLECCRGRDLIFFSLPSTSILVALLCVCVLARHYRARLPVYGHASSPVLTTIIDARFLWPLYRARGILLFALVAPAVIDGAPQDRGGDLSTRRRERMQEIMIMIRFLAYARQVSRIVLLISLAC